jgi:Lon protease-like protein
LKPLPLFPLPIVLLPGTALPLHIFEPRYRRLVSRCREQHTPFGLIYHDPDVHGPFLSEPGRVGTEAHIEVFQPLPDGRSLILVRGGERFAIGREMDAGEPYYEALVEPYGDRPHRPISAELLLERRRASSALLERAVAAAGGEAEGALEVDVTHDVSFHLARSVQIDPAWLQALLELTDERARLERLDVIFWAAIERRRGPAQS